MVLGKVLAAITAQLSFVLRELCVGSVAAMCPLLAFWRKNKAGLATVALVNIITFV